MCSHQIQYNHKCIALRLTVLVEERNCNLSSKDYKTFSQTMAHKLKVVPFLFFGGIIKAILSDTREKVEGHVFIFILPSEFSEDELEVIKKDIAHRIKEEYKLRKDFPISFDEDCLFTLQKQINEQDSLMCFTKECASLSEIPLTVASLMDVEEYTALEKKIYQAHWGIGSKVLKILESE